MFKGLGAFPLTPLTAEGAVDEEAFARLVQRLAGAGVDSIGALGSTGSAAYLTRRERAAVTKVAVANAGHVPVVVGVGALRTREVLHLVDDAQERGAAGVLLPAMTYQPLTDSEVLGLYEEVASVAAVPIANTHELSSRLRPFWSLFAQYGSYRVVAAVAVEMGLVGDALPRPVRGLDAAGREAVVTALAQVRAGGCD